MRKYSKKKNVKKHDKHAQLHLFVCFTFCFLLYDLFLVSMADAPDSSPASRPRGI